MRVKVGEIPYLNSIPFYWNKEASGAGQLFDWAALTPSAMGAKAKKGELDAGPFSLADSFELEDRFEPLGGLGIAVKDAAKSVLLFSRKPLYELDRGRIGLTPETVTSALLLRFILEKKYGISPVYKEGFADSDDAQLLIGDAALRAQEDSKTAARFPLVVDLGEEWRRWQGLPFVFARWMVRKDLGAGLKKSLLELLERNIAADFTVLSKALSGWEDSGGWYFPGARTYLRAFEYRFGPEERKAMEDFRRIYDGMTLEGVAR